jgi:hypothetical protein
MNKTPSLDEHRAARHEVLLCKRCGSSFECNVGDVIRCQCSGVLLREKTRQFLDKTYWGCLCVGCLKEINDLVSAVEDAPFPKGNELIEGKHYYNEHGFMVFTELYHLHRGACCNSGCRHCAYGFKKE